MFPDQVANHEMNFEWLVGESVANVDRAAVVVVAEEAPELRTLRKQSLIGSRIPMEAATFTHRRDRNFKNR